MSLAEWHVTRKEAIARGEHVECSKCEEMRGMGWPRPRCKEDCEKPEVSHDEGFLWLLMNRYYSLMVLSNGMGGWSVNTEGVKMVCDKFNIDDRMEFTELLIDVVGLISSLHRRADEKAEKDKGGE